MRSSLETSPAAFIAAAYQAYATLLESNSGSHDLGGKLLYAGELNGAAHALIAAGNVAGAATLAASADPVAGRQAMRAGIVDFLVNSLDEALRILKNELRKSQPVAVAVSLAPHAVEAEMIERGVLPELLPQQAASDAVAEFLAQGARRIGAAPRSAGRGLRIWPTPAEFAQRPADFEALLLGHIPPEDEPARRWLHLSPRYLGPAARRLRSLPCDDRTAELLIALLGNPEQTPSISSL